MSSPSSPAVVVIVGAGALGVSLFERLAAHAPALLAGRPLEIRVVDPRLSPEARHAVRTVPAGVSAQTQPASAVDITGGPDEPQRVSLDAGTPITADLVLLAQGPPGTLADPQQRARAEFAAWHGLRYHRPRRADAPDLGAILASVDVLVRDGGAVTGSLVTLLLERRGGRFVPGPDGGLRYRPTGAEPRVHLLAPERPAWTNETVQPGALEWRRRRAALVMAGVAVRHPATTKLIPDAVRGAFLLHSGGEQVIARTLIEPDAGFGPLRGSADPLLRALAERGELAGWSANGTHLDRCGREHPRRFAFGPLTGVVVNDALVRRMLTSLAATAPRPAPASRRDLPTAEARVPGPPGPAPAPEKFARSPLDGAVDLSPRLAARSTR
jgi:hypothetical protein